MTYLCHMRIYLLGYMGSGKSTLGRSLSVALGIAWTDLDEEFESRYKITIPAFFTKYGENAFRELEHKLLVEFSVVNDIVLSTGGGLPCFNSNINLMNQTGLTIYLEATPGLLLQRISPSARRRPLFKQMQGENILQKITEHLKSREPYYTQSKITIDATNPDIEILASKIRLYYNNGNGAG